MKTELDPVECDMEQVALTARESEVMTVLGYGKGPEEVAKALGLHVDVVTRYMTTIQHKLHLTSHQALRIYAQAQSKITT